MDAEARGHFADLITRAQAAFKQVEYNFDITPQRAIRLKYGRIGSEHVGQLIPHLHLEDKTNLSLTEEISFGTFINWLQIHIPLEE